MALGWRTYRAIALGFLLLKLALVFLARPFMDETYYWLWGQHLALSYFDHPPLVGWTQAVAGVLGWNIFGLRGFVLLTLLGDLLLLRAYARLVGGEGWRDVFWGSAALFLATPIFFGLTNLALPDHLLVFFSLGAIYAFARFRKEWDGGAPRWRWLYLAAVAVGFAILSKYSAALLAACVVLHLAFTPALRGVFRSPHLYLACLLAIVLQAPVLGWNLANDMASFGFIFGGRRITGDLDPWAFAGYLAGIPFVLSPFLLPPVVRFLRSRADGAGFNRLVFWFSTLGFLLASFLTDILVHWNVIAYVAVLPFLALFLRSRRIAIGHFVYGGLLAALLAVNYTLMPITAPFTYTDQTTALSYGWEEVVPRVEQLRREEGAGFIATPWYASASALAFAMRDPAVVSLFPGRDAFDDWFDPAAHAGQTAIIVADRKRGLTDEIRQLFADVRRADRITVERLGFVVERYSIYVARGYTPPPP